MNSAHPLDLSSASTASARWIARAPVAKETRSTALPQQIGTVRINILLVETRAQKEPASVVGAAGRFLIKIKQQYCVLRHGNGVLVCSWRYDRGEMILAVSERERERKRLIKRQGENY